MKPTLSLEDLPSVATLPQTQQVLGVSKATLRKLIDSGELFARKVGRRVIIPKRSLERYLEGEAPPVPSHLRLAG